MATKSYYCVCRCTPKKGIVSMDADLMKQVVSRQMHSVRCAADFRVKTAKALLIGELCVNSGYPRTALRIYESVLQEGIESDFARLGVRSNAAWWHNSLNKDEVLQLARRMDAVWQMLFPQAKLGSWVDNVELYYEDLWFLRFGS